MKIAIVILVVVGTLVAITVGYLALSRPHLPSAPETTSPAMGLVADVAGAYLGALGGAVPK